MRTLTCTLVMKCDDPDCRQTEEFVSDFDSGTFFDARRAGWGENEHMDDACPACMEKRAAELGCTVEDLVP